MISESLYYESSNKVNKIAAYIFSPKDIEPKAIIQISHGMCEYINNYKDVIKFFCDNGYIVCGNDHLGHGATADKESYGFISDNDGYNHMVEDLHQLTVQMKEKYPTLTYFLLGHSMGSLVARAYVSKYGNEIDALIISGTAGKNSLSGIGKLLAKHYIKKDGGKLPNPKMTAISFRGYNRKYKEVNTPFDWLSRDEVVPQNYLKDPMRNFLFTSSAFLDLISLVDIVNKDAWFRKVPKDLPIYIFSGDMDPVGNFGKGVKQVYYKMIENKIDDITLKLYKGARHETLFEINKDEVYQDLLEWVESKRKKEKI
ncbi:MAG: Lysophospholipase [Clostridiales bacterium]|jgi:alpha-beta hydrolase superfamily lysophospholipase|nr:Lysophospholipase [Clostridiales bacterium]